MFPSILNTSVPYVTPSIINIMSLNDVLEVHLSLIVSKISYISFLTLFAVSLFSSVSSFCKRISIFLENFLKSKLVLSIASVR